MSSQVAVAAVLLVGAVLLGRSFVELLRADRGYDPEHVLTARVMMTDRAMTAARRREVFEEILARVGRVAGVRHAAFTTNLPAHRARKLALVQDAGPRRRE